MTTRPQKGSHAGAVAVALLVVAALAPPTASASDWPQLAYDARRSGSNSIDVAPNATSVAGLHPRYYVALPSVADGSPAFLAGVGTPLGTRDLLFLTTKAGHILAIDAATGSTVWSHPPATGPNYTTSSPAIDPDRRYVYSYGLDGRVHKYQVGDGMEVTTGGWPELATLKPDVEKGSAALAIATAANGTPYLYVANGGYPGDAGDYQGHLTAIDLLTGAQKVFNAACSDQAVHFVENGTPDCTHKQNAVWARVAAAYSPELDRIFIATGNGDFDANAGGHDWGDSVLELAADGSGASGRPLDSYTPTEYQMLQNTDADLGSTAPALLPAGGGAPHLAVQSGKDAELRLLDLDNLSGAHASGHVGGELQKLALPQGGEVLTAPAVWRNPADGGSWIFVANGNGISALTLDLSGAPTLLLGWQDGTGGSSPILVAGVLYYRTSAGVRALEPTTGTQLWSDASAGGLHWESPIVVDGSLYLTDEGGNLWAYTVFTRENGFEAPSIAGAGWSAVQGGV